MSKVLQCLYAYVCNNNYIGQCDSADQLYNLSEGATDKQRDEIFVAVQKLGRVQLDDVYVDIGVAQPSDNGTNDYKIRSYSYFPDVNGKSILTCYALRQSLADVNIRGRKELSHLLMFDQLGTDMYAVDMIGQVQFVTDIELDKQQTSDGRVTEVTPKRMAVLDTKSYVSNSLGSMAKGIDVDMLQTAVNIADAIITSVLDNKTLYIAYEVNDFQFVTDCLIYALKCFPKRVANGLSFITCLGKISRVNANICGIPTNDPNNIKSLESLGNVIVVNQLGVSSTKNKSKGSFASMCNGDSSVMLKWLQVADRYQPLIDTPADLNKASSLYLNSQCETYNQSTDYLSVCVERIQTIIDNLSAIHRVDNEADCQLDCIKQLLLYTKGGIINYRLSAVQKLVNSLCQLYNAFKYSGDAHSSRRVLTFVESILCCSENAVGCDLFGTYFQILSENYLSIKASLDSDILLLSKVICDNWQQLSAYILSFYRDCQHGQTHFELLKDLLNFLFLDANADNAQYNQVHNELVRQVFFNYYADQFEVLLSYVFQDSSTDCSRQFEYMLDLLGTMSDDSSTNDLLDTFVQYLSVNNLLLKAVVYFKKKYATQTGSNQILQQLFYKTLTAYTVPKSLSMLQLYNSFCLAENVLGKLSNASTKNIVYYCLYTEVLCPATNFVEQFTDYAMLTEQDAQSLQAMSDKLSKVRLPDCADKQQFDDALKNVLDGYRTFVARNGLVVEVVDNRIEFVLRELLLLDSKIVYRLAQKYFAKQFADCQQADGNGKPYKQPQFVDNVKLSAVRFLRTASPEIQQKFSQEVSNYRKNFRKVNYLTALADGTKGLIGSLLFSATMTALVGLLSFVVYSQLMQSYFASSYVIICLITFVVCMAIYWDNFKDRRLHNVVLSSLWKACVFVVVSFGIFTLTQYLLITLM